jgi:membrane protein implicated in regulation of membrane protease activity
MTQLVPVIWLVWGSLVLLVLVLKLYARRLARDEDNQLILQDSSEQLKTQQAAIMARIGKVQPKVHMSMWLALSATICMIAYYAFDMVHQFK